MSDLGLLLKYFVLKPKGSSRYARASRYAMRAFARFIGNEDPDLRAALFRWADKEFNDMIAAEEGGDDAERELKGSEGADDGRQRGDLYAKAAAAMEAPYVPLNRTEGFASSGDKYQGPAVRVEKAFTPEAGKAYNIAADFGDVHIPVAKPDGARNMNRTAIVVPKVEFDGLCVAVKRAVAAPASEVLTTLGDLRKAKEELNAALRNGVSWGTHPEDFVNAEAQSRNDHVKAADRLSAVLRAARRAEERTRGMPTRAQDRGALETMLNEIGMALAGGQG